VCFNRVPGLARSDFAAACLAWRERQGDGAAKMAHTNGPTPQVTVTLERLQWTALASALLFAQTDAERYLVPVSARVAFAVVDDMQESESDGDDAEPVGAGAGLDTNKGVARLHLQEKTDDSSEPLALPPPLLDGLPDTSDSPAPPTSVPAGPERTPQRSKRLTIKRASATAVLQLRQRMVCSLTAIFMQESTGLTETAHAAQTAARVLPAQLASFMATNLFKHLPTLLSQCVRSPVFYVQR
jgi:hypothetical protein